MFDCDTVQMVRNCCFITLDAFIEEANKTRRCFEGIEKALDESWLRVLLEQRFAENEALERYQKARRALFVFSNEWWLSFANSRQEAAVNVARAAIAKAPAP